MKKCPKCALEKDLKDFRSNSKRKDGLQAYCKLCDKKFQAEWYLKNKQKHIKKSFLRRKDLQKISQDYVLDYLKTHPCVDCGEKDPIVLEFDHLSNKKFGISKMMHDGLKPEIIQGEIDKCEVRCSNCHKRKTAKQFNWYKTT